MTITLNKNTANKWYFDFDYLTDSLGYTRFKTNPPAGTHATNIIAGTQDDDSESEYDEQVILVPSFPSNSFLGPKVHDVSAPMENNLDYAEELARLQRQEHEAHSAVAKYDFEFSDETVEMLHQAEIENRRNLVLAAGDHAGSIVSTGGVPAGSVPAGSIPTSSVPAGNVPASYVPPSSAPAGSVPISHVPANSIPAGSVPASHVLASSIPAGGVLAGSINSNGFGDPAASEFIPDVFPTDHLATSPLPPGHSLGSYEHSIRFPSPSDLGNHHPTAGIFSFSSYDDDFYADVTNLALNVVVDPVVTKRNKRDAKGVVERNKARLVAQGHRQEEGIDYDEVFAPVARIKAIRLFLAFASYMGFMVYQMDIKSSFLYGKLKKKSWCDEFKVLMKGEFKMSAMGELTFFLRLQVKQLPDEIFISQDKYVKDMLKKFDMESVRTATTPYEVPKHKSKDEPDDAINVHLYRSMIVSLMYLTASRPDIMFTVSAWSRHQLVAYNDSDYAGSHGDRKSTTGGCQFLGGRLISWQCKKQTVIATSSTKAKYVAAASCCGQSTICIIKNPIFHQRTKHIEIQHHFIRDAHEKNLIQVLKIHTDENLANLLTKAFDGPRFHYLASNTTVVPVFLLVVLVPANGWVPTGSCTIPTGSGTFPTGSSTIPTGSCTFPTVDWDGPHMPLLAPMLVAPAGGDGAAGVAAGAAATHVIPPPIPPPIVPLTHSSSSTPGPFTAAQATPVREPSPVREPTLVREPTPSPVREPTPFRQPTPDSPRPPSPPPYPRSEEVGRTTSTRPSTATAASGAEDSAVLTALSLKLDRCINRVTYLENKLGVTKKVLGGAVLKLVTRVKQLEGLLQQKKQRLVLSDSEGEEVASKEQDIDLDALHKLASTSLGGDSTVEVAYTIYKASQDAHASSDASHATDEVPADTMPFRQNISAVEDTLPADEGIPPAAPTIPTGSTTIPAGSSMDPAGQAAAAAPSSTIPAADKGKAPMVTEDFLPADLLSEQECILKNLHDYQLGEELAKKLHAEQEAEFARQQEELPQKAQAERVASPAEQSTRLSDQRRRELDAAQLIYTEADWLELIAKIATNSALSKQLLGDDVNEDNMNERLATNFMRDFVRTQSAAMYNQGWTMKQVKALCLSQIKHEFEYIQRTLERSNLHNFKRTTFRPAPSLEAPFAKQARQEVPQDVHATSSQVPASVLTAPSVAANVLVPAVPPNPAGNSTHVDTEVHTDESNPDDTLTTFEQVSAEHTVATSTPSSSRTRRKHLAKKRVTSIVDIADDALIKFDSTSDSDDDPLPYAPYAEWEMVPSPLGFIHAYYDMEGNTKHFTSLHELYTWWRRMIFEDCWVLLTIFIKGKNLIHFLCFCGEIFTCCFSHLMMRMPMISGIIRMVGVFAAGVYILRMLKHGLEVPKLLVGGDLTMAEQLVSFIKAALVTTQSTAWFMLTMVNSRERVNSP
nr:retrotransposon protein, putative, Ty1-copia subclass [Tanacetum cinerariifolium]